MHILFVAYIAITLVDSVVRKGFLGGNGDEVAEKPVSTTTSTLGGVGIGAVAAFLGIGGSVLTVPLLRRRGVSMAEATAMANPLSLPVAIAGTAVYPLATPAAPHPGQIGYVSLIAAAALLCGSLPTIPVAKRLLVGRIPDRAHAVAYLILLAVILIAMVVTMIA